MRKCNFSTVTGQRRNGAGDETRICLQTASLTTGNTVWMLANLLQGGFFPKRAQKARKQKLALFWSTESFSGFNTIWGIKFCICVTFLPLKKDRALIFPLRTLSETFLCH